MQFFLFNFLVLGLRAYLFSLKILKHSKIFMYIMIDSGEPLWLNHIFPYFVKTSKDFVFLDHSKYKRDRD